MTKKRGKLLSRGWMWITALVFYGCAIWLLMWSVTSAQLNFLPCENGFSIWAEQAECRRPVLLEWAALVALILGLITTILIIRHRRGRS